MECVLSVWLISLSVSVLRFIHVVVCTSSSLSLLLSSVPLDRYTPDCLSILLAMDIWFISCFLLLQIKLLRTFVYKSLYGCMLTFLSGKYLKAEWLNHIITVRLTFQEAVSQFSVAVVSYYIPVF